MKKIPTIEDVIRARSRIKNVVTTTPLLKSRYISKKMGNDIFFKCENFQRTGSFKIRGAYNKIASLNKAESCKGVVTYSSGNHAQAVALASALLGIKSTVFMPKDAPPIKINATREYGADVILCESTSVHRKKAAEEFRSNSGAIMIPPFDDPLIISGQATVGLELLCQMPDVERIVVPVGGGGLLSGILLSIKSSCPDIEVVGVEPEHACAMKRSIESNSIQRIEPVHTIADGLRPLEPGKLTYSIVKRHVDSMVTVTDNEILDAMKMLFERAKLVVEPSGAASLAACNNLLPNKKTVVVLSGGNMDCTALYKSYMSP